MKPDLRQSIRNKPYEETRRFSLNGQEFDLTLRALVGISTGRQNDLFEHLCSQYLGDPENGIAPTLVPPIVKNEDGSSWGLELSRSALNNVATLLLMQVAGTDSDRFDAADWLILAECHTACYNEITAFAGEVSRRGNAVREEGKSGNTSPPSAHATTKPTRKSSKELTPSSAQSMSD